MRWSLVRLNGPACWGLHAGVVDGLNRRRQHRRLAMREAEIQTGSKNIGASVWGHPETWEASLSSPNMRDGRPADQSPGAAPGTRCSERRTVPTVIPRIEGNEVKRDG